MKVLIIDPDPRFGENVRDSLESHTHLVVHLTDASLARDRVLQWKPDIVIIAAELHGDGLLEFLHSGPHRPAVLLTGWMDSYAEVWQAWQRGGHELLMKPVFNSREVYDAMLTARENALANTDSHQVAASA